MKPSLRLAPWRTPLLLLAAIAASFVVFGIVPGLDLWFSGLFYRPESGFFLGNWPPFRLAFRLLPDATLLLVLGLIGMLAVVLALERPVGPFDRRTLPFILLMLALGPGLLTNTVLKDHWGRARPSQVVEFGGARQFTPPSPVPVDQCDRNCSFVSGHGAMAFSVLAFGFLVPRGRRRQLAFGAALGFGGFVGLARIAQGGHFLSDTIFAALFMALLAWLLHRWIVDRDGLAAPWLRRGVTAAGRIVRDASRRIARASTDPLGRFGLLTALSAIAIVVSVLFVDRPLARYFQTHDGALHAWFDWITQFGLAAGWLIGLAAIFLALRLAARSARFAAWRERLTAWSEIPLFIFCSMAASGLVVDLIKILVGRTRPKLLFRDDIFAVTGLAFRADHWSFPSGHTANIVALVSALYVVWPRHIAAYILVALLIALSRVGLAQHYLSDTIGAAYVALVVTAYIRQVFERSGIDLADARAGIMAPRPAAPWRYRLGLGGPHRSVSGMRR